MCLLLLSCFDFSLSATSLQPQTPVSSIKFPQLFLSAFSRQTDLSAVIQTRRDATKRCANALYFSAFSLGPRVVALTDRKVFPVVFGVCAVGRRSLLLHQMMTEHSKMACVFG